ALAREDVPGSVGGEQLEATLRVTDAGHHQPTGARVEGAAHHLPPPRLAHLDARSGKVTGPDRDVVSVCDAGREALDLLDGRRQIGVREDPQVAPGLEHPAPYAGTLAAVHGAVEYAHRQVGHDASGDLGRAVPGAIDDHQDLALPSLLAEIGDDAFQAR